MEGDSTQRGFLAELKRRRVVRVGLVYVAVTYVVSEAADLLFPRLQLPDWTVTLVIALALLGFPIALVLAWAFELTPDGVRRTRPAEGNAGDATWLNLRAAAWAVGLLVAGAVLGWTLKPGMSGRSPGSVAAAQGGADTEPVAAGSDTAGASAIAVLPFANLSANPDSTLHLSDGFHRELVMQLHRIGLDVRSRTSVMRFRNSDQPLAEIASDLGVAHVVEGSVAFSGPAARVSVDLIGVAGDAPLWNETYDLEFRASDVFDTQSDIARRIAGALLTELSPEAEAKLADRPTEDVQAWALVQRGLALWQDPGASRYAEALEAFERAIERDSMYAAAYLGVELMLGVGAFAGVFDAFEAVPRARAAGSRALALDPDVSFDSGLEPRSLLAFTRVWFDWEFEAGRRELDRLVSEGEDPGPFFWLASGLGEHDLAVELLERRVSQDPASPFFRRALSRILYMARRYEAAADAAGVALGLSPTPYPQARILLGSALIRQGRGVEGLSELESAARTGGALARARLAWGYGLTGRAAEARAAFEAALAEAGPGGLSAGAASLAYLGVGDHERAIGALERAADRRLYLVLWLGQDPDLDPLRSQPRFVALMDRVGIPESARRAP